VQDWLALLEIAEESEAEARRCCPEDQTAIHARTADLGTGPILPFECAASGTISSGSAPRDRQSPDPD